MKKYIKSIFVITFFLFNSIVWSQTTVDFGNDWTAYDMQGNPTNYTWHIKFDSINNLYDSSWFYSNNQLMYVGYTPNLYNGIDTAFQMYFSANSFHPCSNLSTPFVQEYMNFYNNLHAITFRSVGVNYGCSSMENLLRNHIWVELGYTVPTRLITGINELNDINNFKLYPNPTNGNFFFQFNSKIGNEYTLEIFNLLGHLMHQQNLKVKPSVFQEYINTEDWANGIYYLHLKDNNHEVVKKIILK